LLIGTFKLVNQCRLVNAVKSKDVDRLQTNMTCQRSQNLTTSTRFEIQNSLTKRH